MKRCRISLLALALTVSLAGCRAATPRPVAAPPPPAGEITPDVHWAATSAEYRAILVQTYRWAERRLEELVDDRAPGTWAVTLDGDETVISNVPYEKELRRAGGDYQTASFNAWTERRAATLLPGAAGFLDRVRQLGGRIAIVTNRDESTCPDTEANLKALSVPFDVVLCRTDESEKEPRWERIGNGTAAPDLPPAEIVMWVGDNIKDFPGLDQDLRHFSEEAYSRFGVDFIIIPNPMYGSWEDNPGD